ERRASSFRRCGEGHKTRNDLKHEPASPIPNQREAFRVTFDAPARPLQQPRGHRRVRCGVATRATAWVGGVVKRPGYDLWPAGAPVPFAVRALPLSLPALPFALPAFPLLALPLALPALPRLALPLPLPLPAFALLLAFAFAFAWPLATPLAPLLALLAWP